MAIRVYSVMADNKKEAFRAIASVGADAEGCEWMAPKAVHRLVMLDGVQPKQANIIKQEMLGKGGEAAVSRGAVDCSVPETRVLLMGTLKQYEAFLAKLRMPAFRSGCPGWTDQGCAGRAGGIFTVYPGLLR